MDKQQYGGVKPNVALLAEGVDRNQTIINAVVMRSAVALLAEGVDRNRFKSCWKKMHEASPSSRRAWIEI